MTGDHDHLDLRGFPVLGDRRLPPRPRLNCGPVKCFLTVHHPLLKPSSTKRDGLRSSGRGPTGSQVVFRAGTGNVLLPCHLCQAVGLMLFLDPPGTV